MGWLKNCSFNGGVSRLVGTACNYRAEMRVDGNIHAVELGLELLAERVEVIQALRPRVVPGHDRITYGEDPQGLALSG